MRGTFALAAGLDDGADRAGILDHVTERVGPELGVERNWHDARPHRAEHGLDEFDTVADRHRQPVAGTHAEPRQCRGDTVEAPIPARRRLSFAAARATDRRSRSCRDIARPRRRSNSQDFLRRGMNGRHTHRSFSYRRRPASGMGEDDVAVGRRELRDETRISAALDGDRNVEGGIEAREFVGFRMEHGERAADWQPAGTLVGRDAASLAHSMTNGIASPKRRLRDGGSSSRCARRSAGCGAWPRGLDAEPLAQRRFAQRSRDRPRRSRRSSCPDAAERRCARRDCRQDPGPDRAQMISK